MLNFGRCNPKIETCGKRKVRHKRINTNARQCITMSSIVLQSTRKRHNCTIQPDPLGHMCRLQAVSIEDPHFRMVHVTLEGSGIHSSAFCFSQLIPHTSGQPHLALWTASQKAWPLLPCPTTTLYCAFHPSLEVAGRKWNPGHTAGQSGFAWATKGWGLTLLGKLLASSKRQEPCRFKQTWSAIETSLWTSPWGRAVTTDMLPAGEG